MIKTLKNFINDKRAATAIEYGLIAAGIAVTIVVAVFNFGDEMQDLYNGLSGLLNGSA